MTRCLNCGAELNSAFCGACGQRAVPADPTVAELAGDAWQELSGYDGRIIGTFRNLFRPGQLTIDYLEGRRARHLSPIRLYLLVSVLYFLVAASVPPTPGQSDRKTEHNGGLTIGLTNPSVKNGEPLSDGDRAELAKVLGDSPWYMRPLLTAISNDPAAFRARIFTIMPRVFFAMLPVFAGIVAVFYRGRRFPTALVFAVHLHAFAFLIFSVSEAAKLTGSVVVDGAIGGFVAIGFAVYALLALRRVFGGRWPITIAKATGIGFVYLITAVPAYIVILFWASVV